MPKFRKKPVVIEAFQMTKEAHETNKNWPEWLHRAWQFDSSEAGAVFGIAGEGLHIRTLEGVHHVSEDDFIIRGVKGELYPCKPDIFAATYDSADSSPAGSFTEAARPLIKWLAENVHPHHTAIVTATNAELLEGQASSGQILEYLKD